MLKRRRPEALPRIYEIADLITTASSVVRMQRNVMRKTNEQGATLLQEVVTCFL